MLQVKLKNNLLPKNQWHKLQLDDHRIYLFSLSLKSAFKIEQQTSLQFMSVAMLKEQ